MKDFIKLPEVFIGETYSEAENRNAGPEINRTSQLLRPSKIHKASCPGLNGTAVLQSIDLQTERLESQRTKLTADDATGRAPEFCWLLESDSTRAV